jgi:hypothetical protein
LTPLGAFTSAPAATSRSMVSRSPVRAAEANSLGGLNQPQPTASAAPKTVTSSRGGIAGKRNPFYFPLQSPSLSGRRSSRSRLIAIWLFSAWAIRAGRPNRLIAVTQDLFGGPDFHQLEPAHVLGAPSRAPAGRCLTIVRVRLMDSAVARNTINQSERPGRRPIETMDGPTSLARQRENAFQVLVQRSHLPVNAVVTAGGRVIARRRRSRGSPQE